MGGLGSGRLPDEARRREAVRLRAQGLPLTEIGRRLGVSRQRAGQIIRAIERERSRTLACGVCGGPAAPAGAAPADLRDVVCLTCLARRPEAPFAERLQSCRAAAGLTRQELARRVGLGVATLQGYEGGTRRPQWEQLTRLVGVLGLALVAPGIGGPPPAEPESCPA